MIINTIYRQIIEKKELILSKFRIINLKLKYPMISVCRKTYIGKNCKIVCTDNSKLIISNTYISNGCFIMAKKGGKIEIKKTYIGPNTVIVAIDSITIEPNVSIAEMVVIRDQDHRFDNLEKHFYSSPITISRNSWLAAKVTVLKGVNIGENSIIGAHALVNKSTIKNSISVGVPAKQVIKTNHVK